jgi:hypothetical protein
MVAVIDPKVTLIDHGPKIILEDGTTITPDQLVWAASLITYKDTGVMGELIELMKEEDTKERMVSGLTASAGAGHASLSTSQGLWTYLEGDCSKFVDSMFTGARFGSSLMPSGRRVPIAEDQIVAPRSIKKIGGEAEQLYLETSQANMQAYFELQDMGVSKQVASKIVQYGHRGGGLVFFPLETIVSLSLDAQADRGAIPQEGLEILAQLEQHIHENGMEVVYEARKAAPRTGCPNPSIFHRRTNLAQEMINNDTDGVLHGPSLLSEHYDGSPEMERRVQEYLRKRAELFKNPKDIKRGWRNILREAEELAIDFDSGVHIKTGTNTPWRVWGEVKRHRTMPHHVESIYHAASRAENIVNQPGANPSDFNEVVSMPNSVASDPERRELWLSRFSKSIETYQRLQQLGIPDSDAIAVIPRGLKLGITKEWGLYNLTTGYMSLRLCHTAEPEMRATTEAERELILGSGNAPAYMSDLLVPKCGYVGFCPDRTHCAEILPFDPTYDKNRHKKMKIELGEQIQFNL